MYGTRWFSFKHSEYCEVAPEPISKNGFYTVLFDSGKYRRYNAERIMREVARSEEERHKSVQAGLLIAEYVEPATRCYPSVEAGEADRKERVEFFTEVGKLVNGSEHFTVERKPGVIINLCFAWRE